MPDLRSIRPEIKYGDVVCERCGKACDFAEYAEHGGSLRPSESILTGRGTLYVYANCHGEQAEIAITFDSLIKMGYALPRDRDPWKSLTMSDGGGNRQKIVAFEKEESLPGETQLTLTNEQQHHP